MYPFTAIVASGGFFFLFRRDFYGTNNNGKTSRWKSQPDDDVIVSRILHGRRERRVSIKMCDVTNSVRSVTPSQVIQDYKPFGERVRYKGRRANEGLDFVDGSRTHGI